MSTIPNDVMGQDSRRQSVLRLSFVSEALQLTMTEEYSLPKSLRGPLNPTGTFSPAPTSWGVWEGLRGSGPSLKSGSLGSPPPLWDRGTSTLSVYLQLEGSSREFMQQFQEKFISLAFVFNTHTHDDLLCGIACPNNTHQLLKSKSYEMLFVLY